MSDLTERQFRGLLEYLRYRGPRIISELCLGPYLWDAALCADGWPFDIRWSRDIS